MRLFVAISLPDSITKKLEQFQKDLMPYARDAKWVNPGGIHLTLKFLGEVKQEQLSEIHQALEDSAQRFEPVHVSVKGCGFFPYERRPAVFWVGVEAESLTPLQDDIAERVSLLGFEKEKRAYSPHLTVARFRDPHGRLPLVHETAKKKELEFGSFSSSEFHLYQSVLKRSGAEYTILKSFPLKLTANKQSQK